MLADTYMEVIGFPDESHATRWRPPLWQRSQTLGRVTANRDYELWWIHGVGAAFRFQSDSPKTEKYVAKLGSVAQNWKIVHLLSIRIVRGSRKPNKLNQSIRAGQRLTINVNPSPVVGLTDVVLRQSIVFIDNGLEELPADLATSL